MFFEIIKVFFIGFTAPFKWLYSTIVELLPTIKIFNNIAGAFSWKSILAHYLGIPLSILSIVLFIIRISLPKQQKH